MRRNVRAAGSQCQDRSSLCFARRTQGRHRRRSTMRSAHTATYHHVRRSTSREPTSKREVSVPGTKGSALSAKRVEVLILARVGQASGGYAAPVEGCAARRAGDQGARAGAADHPALRATEPGTAPAFSCRAVRNNRHKRAVQNVFGRICSVPVPYRLAGVF